MFIRALALLLPLLVHMPWSLMAQGPAPSYVSWVSTPSVSSVSQGDSFDITLSARIADGWKLYAMDSPPPSWGARLQIDAPSGGIEQDGDPSQSTPKQAFDKNFKQDVTYFVEEAVLSASFSVAESTDPGPHVVSGKVGYQICNDELGLCLPPYYEPFTVQVDVVEAAASTGGASRGSNSDRVSAPERSLETSPESTHEPVPEEVEEREEEAVSFVPFESEPLDPDAAGESAGVEPRASTGALATGSSSPSSTLRRKSTLWGFILLAIGAGLGALLMPCVFPMIPLTVSYFTKHAHDRGEALRMASVYGLAIVLIFTGLGVLTALLIGASGAQVIAANPWVNLFIGLIFVVFALSLLGLFELRLPSGFVNFFNRQSHERQGYTGVLFMGTTLTLVSFSCTAPFVGTLLAATAGGEWIYPVIGMLVFSATFAAPFFLFALFPNGLTRLPASGQWMNTLKVVFGFIELAAAIKFLSNADLVWGWNIISRPIAIAVTVVILFLTGMYLIGKLKLAHEEATEQIGTLRLVCAIGFFGLSLYMLPGLFGAPLNNLDAFLPPRQGSDVSLVSTFASTTRQPASGDEAWFEDIDAAYTEAKLASKPVFIDFTGYTCTNCRQMESTVFPHASIARRFDRDYVLLRLYTDDLDEGPTLQRFQLELTGTVALPTYAVVDPASGALIARRSGILSVDDFGQFLDASAAEFSEHYLAASD